MKLRFYRWLDAFWIGWLSFCEVRESWREARRG
jgi:hypothetical protein